MGKGGGGTEHKHGIPQTMSFFFFFWLNTKDVLFEYTVTADKFLGKLSTPTIEVNLY